MERGEEMRRKQLGRVRKKGGEVERGNKKRYRGICLGTGENEIKLSITSLATQPQKIIKGLVHRELTWVKRVQPIDMHLTLNR